MDQNAWAGSVDATEEVHLELSARLEFLMPAIYTCCSRVCCGCAAPGWSWCGRSRKEGSYPGLRTGLRCGHVDTGWTLGGHY